MVFVSLPRSMTPANPQRSMKPGNADEAGNL